MHTNSHHEPELATTQSSSFTRKPKNENAISLAPQPTARHILNLRLASCRTQIPQPQLLSHTYKQSSSDRTCHHPRMPSRSMPEFNSLQVAIKLLSHLKPPPLSIVLCHLGPPHSCHELEPFRDIVQIWIATATSATTYVALLVPNHHAASSLGMNHIGQEREGQKEKFSLHGYVVLYTGPLQRFHHFC